eukprot:Lithocolla_globosa_v1_NODE_171_length_5468_cov_4.953076.p2 type:complete len:126 gc:universal NODE_171_length_5468_cov_4.953076:3943-4320(+)
MISFCHVGAVTSDGHIETQESQSRSQNTQCDTFSFSSQYFNQVISQSNFALVFISDAQHSKNGKDLNRLRTQQVLFFFFFIHIHRSLKVIFAIEQRPDHKQTCHQFWNLFVITVHTFAQFGFFPG